MMAFIDGEVAENLFSKFYVLNPSFYLLIMGFINRKLITNKTYNIHRKVKIDN